MRPQKSRLLYDGERAEPKDTSMEPVSAGSSWPRNVTLLNTVSRPEFSFLSLSPDQSVPPAFTDD